MGTRGAFGVLIDGQTKVTYNHWDSYPDGLGQDILDQMIDLFHGRNETLDTVREMARKIEMVTGDTPPTAAQIERLAPFTDLSVGERSTSDWYCLLRGLQGDLKGSLNGGVMIDSRAFLNDSLFCEYAYVVNLDGDRPILEVYRGFQKAEHANGRYAHAAPNRGYYPVALIAEVDILTTAKLTDALPVESEEEEEVTV